MKFIAPDEKLQAVADAVAEDYFWQNIDYDKCQVAIDVGAHMGIWSWYLRQYAPHVLIHAIEPHPDNFALLGETILDIDPPIHAYFAWVGYQKARWLVCRRGYEASHYVQYDGGTIPDDAYLLPLPEPVHLEDFKHIDLLKLDCEGSEFDILLNCEDSTLHNIRYIVGEYHLERGSLDNIWKRLSSYFNLKFVRKTSHLGHFLAINRGLNT